MAAVDTRPSGVILQRQLRCVVGGWSRWGGDRSVVDLSRAGVTVERNGRADPAQKQLNAARARNPGPGERVNAQLKNSRILRKIPFCQNRVTMTAVSPGSARVHQRTGAVCRPIGPSVSF